MCSVYFTISASYRKDVERHVKTAQHLGHVRQVKYLLAILAVIDGQSVEQVALVLRVHAKTIATWVQVFCCDGLQGAPRHKPTGRPPKLTPTQKAALATWIEEGPVKAGFSGACWRSPMVQQRIFERFGVYYNVFGLDHGVGHPLLLLYDIKAPNGQNSNEFKALYHYLSDASLSTF
jgi:transposase